MFPYIRRYLFWAVLAVLFMLGEVTTDLLQPALMQRLIDEGVLGGGSGVSNLSAILQLGLSMAGIALLGTLFGSLNNLFVHLSTQNISNDIRKDCFRRIMQFSFSQMDAYGTGTLVTRVTNDATPVQQLCARFIRGMVRTVAKLFGAAFFMFHLNGIYGLMITLSLPLLLAIMGFLIRRGEPVFHAPAE